MISPNLMLRRPDRPPFAAEPPAPADRIDYSAMAAYKSALLKQAYEIHGECSDFRGEYEEFMAARPG
jgi:hypothetical protein